MSSSYESVAAGVDAGSTTTKAVVLRNGTQAGRAITATGANVRKAADCVLAQAAEAAGVAADALERVVATGYGRRLIESAGGTVTEITALARGARMMYEGPEPLRTVLDIGGQDSKVIALDDAGILRDFAMNDKCAAGTGRFLEVMARALELDLDTLGRMPTSAARVLKVNSLCTVFAESEVVSLLSQGEAVEDIIAGVNASVARRISAMARRVGVREPVLFCGGAAQNLGLRRALEAELGVAVFVPEGPQFVAAYGAAIMAAGGR